MLTPLDLPGYRETGKTFAWDINFPSDFEVKCMR